MTFVLSYLCFYMWLFHMWRLFCHICVFICGGFICDVCFVIFVFLYVAVSYVTFVCHFCVFICRCYICDVCFVIFVLFICDCFICDVCFVIFVLLYVEVSYVTFVLSYLCFYMWLFHM